MNLKPPEEELELNSSLARSSSSPGISVTESVVFLSQKLLGPWGGGGTAVTECLLWARHHEALPAHTSPHLTFVTTQRDSVFNLVNETRAE